jgi:hypothetical protein
VERKEEPEKVLVPVRRREIVREEELQKELEELEEPREIKVPRIPRRWNTY